MKERKLQIEIKVTEDGKDTIKKFKKLGKALEFLESYDDSLEIKFCHIGGYELLRDGTQEEICTSFEEVLELLHDYEIELPFNIDNYSEETITEFLDVIKPVWRERFNDGGGRGWIEY
jgi:hypothetical protein